MVMSHLAVVQTALLFEREGGKIKRGRVMCDEAELLMLDGKPLEADVIVRVHRALARRDVPAHGATHLQGGAPEHHLHLHT